MKKNYISISLSVIAFEESDVVRTSGAGVVNKFTETGVDFGEFFGEVN